ncbi:hypothetical protein LXA43DRAFT_896822 [Ganoderma leucocontextum]|nr:hypothetical protein LXA43DRAFT_896822 [Ganoderma leucocontextum]
MDDGQTTAQAGGGLFIALEHPLNRALKIPKVISQDSTAGELTATVTAAKQLDRNASIVHETTSKSIIEALTKYRQANEDQGYIGRTNPDLLRGATAAIRARKAPYTLKRVKGENSQSDRFDVTTLATDGCLKNHEDEIDIEEPAEYKLSGAKVQAMTQRLAYKAIRSQKDKKTGTRPRTRSTLNKIAQGIETSFGRSLPDKAIWKSLRKKTVTREVRQFIWMTIHDGYMVGSQWLRPNMSDELKARATCKVCNEVDSMQHILFECRAPERDLIWKLFRQTWALTKRPWHEPSWGTSAGAACATFKSPKGKRMPEAEDLWTVLATESLHLIWKMRCERVIQNDGEPFSRAEVRNRWYSTIEHRFAMERMIVAAQLTTSKPHAKQVEKLEETWLPILKNTHKLPYDWAVNSGVLVGIKRGR